MTLAERIVALRNTGLNAVIDDTLWRDMAQDPPGGTPLTRCAAVIPLSAARPLLAMKDVLDVVDAREGHTALSAAVRMGRTDLVGALLRAGADPNAQDGRAFLAACSKANSTNARMLLKAGANPQRTAGDWVEAITARFDRAHMQPHEFVGWMAVLHAHGRCENLVDLAYDFAAADRNPHVLSELAVRGIIDGTACLKTGPLLPLLVDPARWAYMGAWAVERCAGVLLQAGADPDACNGWGRAPLESLCRGARLWGDVQLISVARVLLDHGADPLRNSEGLRNSSLVPEDRAPFRAFMAAAEARCVLAGHTVTQEPLKP